jgi:hypothetical protein
MSKKFLVTMAVVFAVGAVGVLLVHEYADPTRTKLAAVTEKDLAEASARYYGPAPAMQSTPERIEPERKVRLALGSIGLPEEQQNRNVGDLVLAQLTGAAGLELVERQALDAVLNELQLSFSGLVRAKDVVHAGKLLRADWFLLGTPAVVNGTNVAVIRIVDARTGVMRDAAMIPSGEGAPALASMLAAFVRQSRQAAADPKPRSFLAIGSFEDLSVNSRQAALPRQLRSHLTAAFQRGGVAMLEREFVNTLLKEMYLDLAGLTEESVTNAPKPMQAAYWLVDGFYQSYETTNLQVELVLNVRRMFGRSQRFELREKPGEPLFRAVKGAIDQVMKQGDAGLAFSRMTEMKALLSTGKELARIGGSDHLDHIWASYQGSTSENEMARRVRNTEEAVRAFETVLLLDPTNREARMCLAACFRKTLIQRMNEASDYYREIIDSPIEDRWSNVARQALVRSFEWSDPDSRRQWFERAAQGTANTAAAEFYQANAKRAAEDAAIQRGGSTKAGELAEARLFERIKSFDKMVHTGSGSYSADLGMDSFASALGNDRAMIARRLTELFPKMQAQFADLAPFFLATIVSFQVDSNAPIIAEFERTLEWCVEHPDKIPQKGTTFWSHIRSIVYDWALKHQRSDLAAKVLESISRAALVDSRARSSFGDDDDYMTLAFAYVAAERWKDALTVFESFTNHPIEMGSGGPWGRAFTVVLPNKQAAKCRQKLGLPVVIDTREFDLGEPCLHPHSEKTYYDRLTFLTASDGLWIGLNDHVMRVDFNLQTNIITRLPPSGSAPVSTLCIGASNVWIGTAGGGLFELDKFTHKIQRFTEKEGMLMNDISGLHLAGDTLWIGYGNDSAGGLGRLDLNTRRFVSFSASLSSRAGETGPPRAKVSEIQARPAGDVWFRAHSALFRYRPTENIWEAQPNQKSAWAVGHAMDDERLIEALSIGQVELTLEPKTGRNAPTNVAAKTTRVRLSDEESARFQATLKTNGSGLRVSGLSSGTLPHLGELEVRTFRDGQRRRLLDGEKLPGPATALALQGSQLWVGGQGFVALVDLDENKIKKITYVPARTIDQIQIGGGYAWVQFDKHIYRTSLREFR